MHSLADRGGGGGNPYMGLWGRVVNQRNFFDLRLQFRAHILGLMHQSIPSANIPPGKFFEVVKSPAPGQNFSAKARPPGQGNTYPRGVF